MLILKEGSNFVIVSFIDLSSKIYTWLWIIILLSTLYSLYIFFFQKLFLLSFLPCSSLCITTFPVSYFCIDLCFRIFFLLFSEQEARAVRVKDVHTLVHRLPQQNQEMLDITIKHLHKWVMCKMWGTYSTDVKDSDHLGYYAEWQGCWFLLFQRNVHSCQQRSIGLNFPGVRLAS